MPRISLLPAALLLLLAGRIPPAPAAAPAAEGPLVSSLSVRTGEGAVQILLQVTNASAAPVEVVFPSGQAYDFAVRRGGTELWRWSAGMAFTQAVRTVVVAPDETLEFAGSWTPPAGTTGELELEASLASSSHPLVRTAPFRLP
jgi:hypothetical protein